MKFERKAELPIYPVDCEALIVRPCMSAVRGIDCRVLCSFQLWRVCKFIYLDLHLLNEMEFKSAGAEASSKDAAMQEFNKIKLYFNRDSNCQKTIRRGEK